MCWKSINHRSEIQSLDLMAVKIVANDNVTCIKVFKTENLFVIISFDRCEHRVIFDNSMTDHVVS